MLWETFGDEEHVRLDSVLQGAEDKNRMRGWGWTLVLQEPRGVQGYHITPSASCACLRFSVVKHSTI